MAKAKSQTEFNTSDVYTRIHKVVGQCNGIERMIKEGAPCETLLLQINAAKSALHRIGQVLLERTIAKQIHEGMRTKSAANEAVEKTSVAIDYFCRMK